jgi:hypothetical protein
MIMSYLVFDIAKMEKSHIFQLIYRIKIYYEKMDNRRYQFFKK